jgi:hypothetical protein
MTADKNLASEWLARYQKPANPDSTRHKSRDPDFDPLEENKIIIAIYFLAMKKLYKTRKIEMHDTTLPGTCQK